MFYGNGYEEAVYIAELESLGDGITIELHEREETIGDLIESLEEMGIGLVVDYIHFGILTIAEDDFTSAKRFMVQNGYWWDYC